MRTLAAFAIVPVLMVALPFGAVAAEPMSFNADIRPILSEHCFACHGPDAADRAADLRLDTRDGATADLGGHAAVVPKASGRSELIARLRATDPDVKMPPPHTGKAPSAEQIALLETWIDEGAQYQGHWAYESLLRPATPATADRAARHPIDAFVDRDLARHGVTPVGEADRPTLIRRLFLDLTGLPPTPADVDVFVADPRPDAYELWVDRLLASPHHAERLAQWWLDLARYADTVGYHGDQPMSVWPYRDWVIAAFRDNMPFDRFTREQLAGDLTPNASRDNKIAAVYNRLALMSAEGGGQEKEYLARYAADRVRGVSAAWLGSTVGCAECHDHKYDPFMTRDFYALSAYFADIQEKGIYDGFAAQDQIWGKMERFYSRDEEARLADLDQRLAQARKDHDADTPELCRARETWIAAMSDPTKFEPLVPVAMKSAGGATLVTAAEHSVLAQGARPDEDEYTLVFDLPPGPLGAIRLEPLADTTLPAGGGPGRAGNGNFVITEVTAALRPAAASDIPERQPDDMPIQFSHASADFEQSVAGHITSSGKWLAAYTIDGDASGPTVGWAVHEEVGKSHRLLVRPAQPIDVPAGMRLVFSIAQHHGKGFTLGRFRVSVAAQQTDDTSTNELPKPITAAVATPAAERTPTETAAIANHHRSIAPEWKDRRDALAAAEKARTDFLAGVPAVPVTVSGKRRPTRILPRGNWMDDSGAEVMPAPPAFLPQPPADPGRERTRRDLADWLVARENPLVPRVLANRLWAICFGQGLSRRLDDHGSQGEPPSHPELLDWLACELRDGGPRPWDIRHVVKLIVTSAAYRRSSTTPRDLADRDPDNRLLARQNRYRVDAENVRDTMLAVSGLLSPAIGGPSVKPYQPDGYWDYLNFPKRTYVADTGEKLHRRGLYTWWQRQYLHPAMLVFDAPSREECTARRPRSNTPLQALVLLNDPASVEAARALAAKTIVEAGDDPLARGRFMLRRAVGRVPSDAEVEVVVRLAQEQREGFAKDVNSAKQFLAVGAFAPPPQIDPVDLAAWTSAARAVLALHETIARN